MLIQTWNPACDKCGRTSELIAGFAHNFRLLELKQGRRPPGNLCGKCAAELTADRLIHEAEKAFGYEEKTESRH